MPLDVPCGQCIGCRLARSREWAVKCMHEASLHDRNCFVTLTYDDKYLPLGGSLRPRDMVLFMKRLRRKFDGCRIRFFQCGEYGELLQRPHHHLLLFGFDFDDKYFWTIRRGHRVYRSSTLEELWPFGLSELGSVTFESAAYVARYITKKIVGDKAESHYVGRVPEFITFSNHPGIAHDWIVQYHSDVYGGDFDRVVVRDDLIIKPARYYDKIYDLIDHDHMIHVKCKRKLRALGDKDSRDPARRAVKERVQQLRLAKLKRGLDFDI